MNIPFFLYRRLSPWITCEFNFSENSKVSLDNKFAVASFKDVFCHPFYWQVFQYIQKPPQLIVDCGAHCGHFSVLTNTCIQSKFDNVQSEYLLVEPNPYLQDILQKTISNAGFATNAQIYQGLLGKKSGNETLWINPKNYLATSLKQNSKAKPHVIDYLNLEKTDK
ncbi:hypothetical protein HRE53_01090 [Acaryochloris sp. 'Moss Beach']|uniref:hypothetical protein n=1 Tax=Acaryochloris sp. 'Moss Beach' TaxID=2740837 RepID=UPI001F203808|nr:hypothetical protein [Acaryochloris sp. 'Moss Beach']UJB69825.1 hypothetical protein HRE53_01090 [Acaryochloris sp. 'Moss Beach']